ncbi:MAG: EcsC family protein [Sarcina sp.]
MVKVLNKYEVEQIKAIEYWKHEKIDLYDKSMAILTKPFSGAIEKVASEKIVRGLLKFTWNVADSSMDYKRVIKEAKVEKISDLKNGSLKSCDDLARNAHKRAVGIAAAQGITVGSIGLIGLAVDIPFILSIALRTIMRIGACYGYEFNSKYEKEFALSVLGAGAMRTLKEREKALAIVNEIEHVIDEKDIKKLAGKMANKTISKEIGIMSVHAIEQELEIEISKEISIMLLNEKFLETIPIVGSAIGALINTKYINHMGWAAIRLYQHRWLVENGKITIDDEIIEPNNDDIDGELTVTLYEEEEELEEIVPI